MTKPPDEEKRDGEAKPNSGESESSSDLVPDVDAMPGVEELQAVVEKARREAPSGKTVRRDLVAGLTATVASVPEGMAMGLLAGVNPVYGLYASTVGPIAGGLLASTRLMVITNTGAASLAAGQALAHVPPGERDSRLFLMVVLAGLLAIAFGVLGLGRLTRLVSYSVMIGFLAGIAMVLILSQLPVALGYEGEGENRLSQTWDLLTRLEEVEPVTLGVAISAIAITGLLQRTRISAFASLFGIALPTVLVLLLGFDGVELVRDVGEIPQGMPIPILPEFKEAPEVFTGALAIAVIVLVQGAGVGHTVPNPDGSRSSASRDFIAQGVANVAAGVFRGLPVGGSVSVTALSVSAGAHGRWATVFSGLWMALIVIAVPGLVARVAMPALAGLLILVGVQIIVPKNVTSVWRAGWSSRLACATTFVGTLLLPIQAAVALGVALSTVLYVNRASAEITVVERVDQGNGQIEEHEPPQRLPADRVTVLDVYGQLFYGGGRTLERRLPLPEEGSEHPVVILRLHGRTRLGATVEEVLSIYAEKLEAAGGRLYLAGLSDETYDEVARMAKLRRPNGSVRVYHVSGTIGQSTDEARRDAEAWLRSVKQK